MALTVLMVVGFNGNNMIGNMGERKHYSQTEPEYLTWTFLRLTFLQLRQTILIELGLCNLLVYCKELTSRLSACWSMWALLTGVWMSPAIR